MEINSNRKQLLPLELEEPREEVMVPEVRSQGCPVGTGPKAAAALRERDCPVGTRPPSCPQGGWLLVEMLPEAEREGFCLLPLNFILPVPLVG